MSKKPLTYESVLEMIRKSSRKGSREIQEIRRLMQDQSAEFDRRSAEFDRRNAELDQKMQKTDRQIKKTSKDIGALGNRIGTIVERMLGRRIINKFQALGYTVEDYSRNHYFQLSKLGIKGEIDLILHDGDVSILIEVKTTLETADVRKHMETMEKFRLYANARWNDPTRFIGAVAGAVVDDEAKDLAHANGMYVIVQSGEAVEIVPQPEGFQAKEW